jgi:hypothetical protein
MTLKHKFAHGQTVCVGCTELYEGKAEVAALLDEPCDAHGAPRYGCIAESGDHFTFCEEMLAGLNPTQRRSLN